MVDMILNIVLFLTSMIVRFKSKIAYYATVGLIFAKHKTRQNTGAKKFSKHIKIQTNAKH